MKSFLPLLVATAATPLLAEVEDELTLGVEAYTGYHSNSIYRGLEIGEDILDFQLSTEVALNNDWLVGLTGWYASGDNSFSENAGELSLIYRASNWELSGGLTYRDFDAAPIVESGAEIFLASSYTINEDLSVDLRLSYDDAAESIIAEPGYGYSRVINDNAYWGVHGSLVIADDFYGASGLVSGNVRLFATYNINSQLSITPYLGHSENFDQPTLPESSTYGGIWLAISF